MRQNPIIVIGGGIAGLATALRLAPLPVVLIAASPLGTGAATALAQGGIAAALGDDDTPHLHADDALAAAIDEKGTFAAQRFGRQRHRVPPDRNGCRMKLHEFEVAQHRASAGGKGKAGADGRHRIGRMRIKPTDAACREHHASSGQKQRVSLSPANRQIDHAANVAIRGHGKLEHRPFQH